MAERRKKEKQKEGEEGEEGEEEEEEGEGKECPCALLVHRPCPCAPVRCCSVNVNALLLTNTPDTQWQSMCLLWRCLSHFDRHAQTKRNTNNQGKQKQTWDGVERQGSKQERARGEEEAVWGVLVTALAQHTQHLSPYNSRERNHEC